MSKVRIGEEVAVKCEEMSEPVDTYEGDDLCHADPVQQENNIQVKKANEAITSTMFSESTNELGHLSGPSSASRSAHSDSDFPEPKTSSRTESQIHVEFKSTFTSTEERSYRRKRRISTSDSDGSVTDVKRKRYSRKVANVKTQSHKIVEHDRNSSQRYDGHPNQYRRRYTTERDLHLESNRETRSHVPEVTGRWKRNQFTRNQTEVSVGSRGDSYDRIRDNRSHFSRPRPASRRSSRGFNKIRVARLRRSVTSEDILDVFCRYGNVIYFDYPTNVGPDGTRNAYLSFSNEHAAQRVLRNLNGRHVCGSRVIITPIFRRDSSDYWDYRRR